MYQVRSTDSIQRLTLVLSNGYFQCSLPEEADPLDQSEALLEITTAACRENARHVRIELLRGDGADWVGSYPGDSHADSAQIDHSQPRLSNASYYGINEAVLVSGDAFVRRYGVPPGGDIQLTDIGDTGEVEVLDDAEHLVGRFSFPAAGLSGSFRAIQCDPDSTLFALLEASPVATCPRANP